MIGILNDKAVNDDGVMIARIDDKPYKVLSYVLPFLEKIEKGSQVEFTLNKEDRISKIARARQQQRDTGTQAAMNKAGFGQPQEEKKDCTSSITPVQSGLKTVEGQIVFINPEQHKITLKDRAGETHTFIWPPVMHEKMSGLKQWWFAKLTGEHEADVDLWKLTAQDFFKRPDDWPFAKGGSGGGKWQPRNERLIVFQCTYKECCETVRQQMMAIGQDFDEAEYNRVMDIAVARAIADGKRLIEAGGA